VGGKPVGHHAAEGGGVVAESRPVDVVPRGGGGDLHLLGLLRNVCTFGQDRSFIPLDLFLRHAGGGGHLGSSGTAADFCLDVAGRQGHGGSRGRARRGPAGSQSECLIDRQPEHCAGGAA
jgi:hypothetical protein